MYTNIQIWGELKLGEDILFPQQPAVKTLAQFFTSCIGFFAGWDEDEKYVEFLRGQNRASAIEFRLQNFEIEVALLRLWPDRRHVSGESFILEFWDSHHSRWETVATEVRYEMPSRTDLIDWLSGNGSLRFKIITP